ncbi:ComEC/Rec2 family competence protein [Labrys monachus]|uniref:Competence protein ComEC n=1 Tax=Labrys monachus TaxID=217067 RepID=A0ABU0FF22_9HYPH|nr:ComEC/Rec2 family competence protein [Labrys monachus]MDQ0393214.1 competence protein ComEC [Labrys monachus]
MPENERSRIFAGVPGRAPGQAVLVWPGAGAGRWMAARLRAWLAGALSEEVAGFDLALVVPVFLGIGVIAYFAAPEEPGLAGPLLATSLAAAAAVAMRGRWGLHVVLVCVAAIGVGFCAARLRTISVAAPQLVRPLAADVTGLVLSVDAKLGGGARIVLRPGRIDGLAGDAVPSKVRLTVRSAGDLAAGDTVTVKALLRPPPSPAVPGGYDFARDAFFDGIGAVGFVAGKVTRAARPIEPGFLEDLGIRIDRQRNALTARIVDAIPGEDGAIAASQVTGKRGQIPDSANDALRASGLYHVVSISGLHMALFAGGLFWLIRAILALSQRIVLYRGAKELAAVASLLPAAAYTLFSGAEVATVRSFIMTAIVLVATAFGRSAITRRNVALSASFILLTTPEQVLGPSFQMSFAAVAMLVAGHEWWGRRRKAKPVTAWERALGAVVTIVLAMMLTTTVASLATAPFSAFHFHRLTLQSLASNLVATPIVSFMMMPLALVALVAEPFGYGAPVWWAMGVTVGWFMDIARFVATWPGSDLVLPQFSAAALACFAAALVLLAILRSRLALVAVLPLGCGLCLAAAAQRPVALFGANGHAALVRDGDVLTALANRSDKFAMKEWLLAIGDRRQPDDASLAERRLCDKEGCSAPLQGGGIFMLDHTDNAVEEDCGNVTVLAGPLPIPPHCAGDGVVLGRDAVYQAGSIALYEDPPAPGTRVPQWRVVMAREPASSRPWAPAYRPARRPAAAVPPAAPEAGDTAVSEETPPPQPED